MTEQFDETVKPDRIWFHGSPTMLTQLRIGSSITAFREIAKAYSHKPRHLELSVLEDTEKNVIHVEVIHDGSVPGFLYEVLISTQDELRKPDENLGPLGEEMITTQEIALRLIGETEVKRSYTFDLEAIYLKERRTLA